MVFFCHSDQKNRSFCGPWTASLFFNIITIVFVKRKKKITESKSEKILFILHCFVFRSLFRSLRHIIFDPLGKKLKHSPMKIWNMSNIELFGRRKLSRVP